MAWYEKIRQHREAMGLSQADLAKKADISQAAINKIEAGRVARSRFMPRLARILGIPLRELDTDFDSDLLEKDIVPPHEVEPRFLDGSYLYDKRGGNTPIHNCSPGPENEMWLEENPISFIDRPSYLNDYKDLLAVSINTSVMAPELDIGDIVFCYDDLPPLVGSTNIYFSKHYRTPRSRLCKIGRLVSVTAEHYAIRVWLVSKRQEDTEVLQKSDWYNGHRILAKYYADWDQLRPGHEPRSNDGL